MWHYTVLQQPHLGSLYKKPCEIGRDCKCQQSAVFSICVFSQFSSKLYDFSGEGKGNACEIVDRGLAELLSKEAQETDTTEQVNRHYTGLQGEAEAT